MSDDIVEMLGASVHQCRAVDRSELLKAAAAEIETLRQDRQYNNRLLERLGQASLELLVVSVERWAEARKIIPNSNPQSQLMKTVSELGELADATLKGDREGIIDGVGDVLVTLAIYCRLQGISMNECLAAAYETIKDRKGTLTAEGVFVKEEG